MHSPGPARQGSALLSAATLCVVCMTATAGRPVQADDGVSPAAPSAPPSPQSTTGASSIAVDDGEAARADGARIAARRQALNEYLVREREYSVLLSHAEESLAAGRTTDALRSLQGVLDAP